MKHVIALLFFCTIALLPLEAKLFDGMIVMKNGDTIQGQIDVRVNLFDSDLVNPLTCKKSLKVVQASGEKIKYLPSEVQSFVIYNTKEGDMQFESQYIKKENCFVQLIHDGPLKVYKYYFPHGYDSSVQHHYLLKSQEVHYLRLLPNKWRRQLVSYFPNSALFKKEREARQFRYHKILDLIKAYETSIS
ncbi:MAG: hypothetical protein AAF705_10720 [Bacteroidota bacterium]